MAQKKRTPPPAVSSRGRHKSNLLKDRLDLSAVDKKRALGVPVGTGKRKNGATRRIERPRAYSGYLTPEADRLVPGRGILAFTQRTGSTGEKRTEDSLSDSGKSRKNADTSHGDTPRENDRMYAERVVSSAHDSGQQAQDSTELGDADFIAFGLSDEEDLSKNGMAKQFMQYEKELDIAAEKKEERWRKQFSNPLPVPTLPQPWLKSRPRDALASQFSKEILDYVAYTKPTKEETLKREDVVRRVKGLVSRMWPRAKADVFGSFPTGLYLPGADIDMVVNSPEKRLTSRSELYRLSDRIRRNGWASRVEVISRARVPLIKFVDSKTGLNIDISFEQENGMRAVPTVLHWLKEMPALRPLVLVIKEFLRRRKLSDVYHGGLGGFATICMVASFLKNHPQVSAGDIDPLQNLGVLLMQFFELYGGSFNAQRHALGMTGDMKYIPKVGNVNMKTQTPNMLAIQDPHDPHNNITRASFNYESVRKEFGHGLDLLKRVCSDYAALDPKERSQKSYIAVLLRSMSGAGRHKEDVQPDSDLGGEDEEDEEDENDEEEERIRRRREKRKEKRERKRKREQEKRRDGDDFKEAPEKVIPKADAEQSPPPKASIPARKFPHDQHTGEPPTVPHTPENVKKIGSDIHDKRTRSTATELFEAASSSQSSDDGLQKGPVEDTPGSDSEKDSRVRLTTEERRSYWRKKARIEND